MAVVGKSFESFLMAASLSGLSSFSTCLASTTSKTASFHLHKKTNRVSFSAPLVTPSVLRSKRLPSLFAASGDIDVEVDTSQPEPVEAQLASAAAVASETPKGAEVFAVVMVCSHTLSLLLVLLLSSNFRIVSSYFRLVPDSTLFFPDDSSTPKDSKEQMSMTR